MNDNRYNIDPERNKEDLKAWIESHHPVKLTKTEEFIDDLTVLVVSHDKDIVNRIGDWLKYNGREIDVALVEIDEVMSRPRF